MAEWWEEPLSINTSDYYGSYDPTQYGIFPSPTFQTDGTALVDTRSNTSFWSMDQSKIGGSLQNILGSVTEAVAKTGLQVAQSSMNKGTKQAGFWGDFSRNFQSTKTGAQLNAGAYATQLQNFLFNPIVWFVAIAGIVLFLIMRR